MPVSLLKVNVEVLEHVSEVRSVGVGLLKEIPDVNFEGWVVTIELKLGKNLTRLSTHLVLVAEELDDLFLLLCLEIEIGLLFRLAFLRRAVILLVLLFIEYVEVLVIFQCLLNKLLSAMERGLGKSE